MTVRGPFWRLFARISQIGLVLTLFLASLFPSARAETGVFEDRIVFASLRPLPGRRRRWGRHFGMGCWLPSRRPIGRAVSTGGGWSWLAMTTGMSRRRRLSTPVG